jgi:hypothetical protein
MITNQEYLSKRDVMTVLEQLRDTPVKLTRGEAMRRAVDDVDSLMALPVFQQDYTDCDRRVRAVRDEADRRLHQAVKVARVIRYGANGISEVLRIDGIVHEDDGMTVTVS